MILFFAFELSPVFRPSFFARKIRFEEVRNLRSARQPAFLGHTAYLERTKKSDESFPQK